MSPDRIYRHFCMGARALEVIGERWTLLIVRDLLLGPLRFTDLERGLNDITPTRLTSRLRLLESEGIISRDNSQRGRDVWYSLTDAGRDLEPVIDALIVWGMEHTLEGPVDGEPIPPHPTMIGTKVWLNRNAPPLPDGLAWVWRFPGDDEFTLRLGDGAWEVARGGEPAAAVTVLTSREAWARFLTTPRERRRLPTADIGLEGSRAELRRFAKGFRAEFAAR
jgi:DNA-binding HxlR family transcriptional regulator